MCLKKIKDINLQDKLIKIFVIDGQLDLNTVYIENQTIPNSLKVFDNELYELVKKKDHSGDSGMTVIKRHFMFDILDAIGFISPIERDIINHQNQMDSVKGRN